MKKIFTTSLFILLLLPAGYAFCQISIVNVFNDFDDNGFPIFNVTLQNDSKESVIINTLLFKLNKFDHKTSKSPPDSKELKPGSRWAVSLPMKPGAIRKYNNFYPVEIESGKGYTIAIRMYVQNSDGTFTPDDFGLFSFSLTFIDGKGQQATTKTLEVGKR